MKPVVGLDGDGVLLDFNSAALMELHLVCGVTFDPSIIRTWDVFESLPPEMKQYEEETYRRMKLPGGCRQVRPYPGAQKAVDELRKYAEVIVVTSPFKGSPTWTHERESVLYEQFGIPHEDVLHVKRKGFVKCDILVDDKVKNLQEWRSAHPRGTPIYWSAHPTAELPAYVVRTQDWADVISEAKSFCEPDSDDRLDRDR